MIVGRAQDGACAGGVGARLEPLSSEPAGSFAVATPLGMLLPTTVLSCGGVLPSSVHYEGGVATIAKSDARPAAHCPQWLADEDQVEVIFLAAVQCLNENPGMWGTGSRKSVNSGHAEMPKCPALS